MSILKRFCSVLLFCFLSFYIISNEISNESLTPDEIAFYALKASGTDESSFQNYINRLEKLRHSFLAEINGMSHEEAAEYSLTFLYRDTLSTYSLNQTRIDSLLDSKKYNCVSSSIIVLYLLRSANIPCRVIEATQHSFLEVNICDKWIRIETTNPYGFNPGEKKESPDSKYYYVVPEKNYRNAHAVSDRRGVSLIYNNRIADYTNTRKSHIAYPLAIDAYELQLHSQESLELVQSIASNLISEYVDKKNFEEGLIFIRETKDAYGLSKTAERNTEALISEISNKMTKAKQYKECFKFLDSVNDLLTKEKILTYKFPAIQNYVYNIFDTEGYDSAVTFLQKQNILSEKQMNQVLKNLKQNEAANIHNSVVPLVNSKRYDEAAEILKSGINKIGNEKILINDLKRLEPFLSR